MNDLQIFRLKTYETGVIVNTFMRLSSREGCKANVYNGERHREGIPLCDGARGTFQHFNIWTTVGRWNHKLFATAHKVNMDLITKYSTITVLKKLTHFLNLIEQQTVNFCEQSSFELSVKISYGKILHTFDKSHQNKWMRSLLY